MPLNNFEIKYNLKSNVLEDIKSKKRDTVIKSQNMNENDLGTIYAPDFSRYPRWPYENYEDYQDGQPNQPTNNQPNFQPSQPINNQPNFQPSQPINNQPNFQPSQPINNQPNFQPSQPINNQPNFQPSQPINNQPNFQPSQPINNQLNFQPNQPINNQPNSQPIRNPYVPVGRERLSSGYIETTFERDLELMRALYTRINEELYPIVVEVLNEYEYDGSPIYDKEIDRESIAQLTDRVLKRAGEISDDAQEAILDEQNIMIEDRIFEWTRGNLLKATAEALLLNEIFSIRRPHYRRVRNRYRYSDGSYNGINYY